MPVTKSAKKALRQDRKRAEINQRVRTRMKNLLQKALEDPSSENIQAAYSGIDRAAKKGVIHANRAARLKSRVMRNASEKNKAAGF